MALDLQKISGLPISFDLKSLKLEFQGDFPFIKKSERTLKELQPYLKIPKNIRIGNVGNRASNTSIYYVWRYAHLKKDGEKIKAADLRYDLTLIPPGKIDGEFVKTAGHCHLPYPEIYEVLLGRAYFLLQSFVSGKDLKNIKSVYLIEAGPGEKIIIPPGFGHNTINVFNEPLLTANLVSEKATHDYAPYKNNHGASYYFLDNGNLIDIVKNPNYDSVPEIKKIRAKKDPLPLYSLINNLDKLRFLNYPEEFKGEWRNW